LLWSPEARFVASLLKATSVTLMRTVIPRVRSRMKTSLRPLVSPSSSHAGASL